MAINNLDDLDEHIKNERGMYVSGLVRYTYKTNRGHDKYQKCNDLIRTLFKNHMHLEGANEWFSALVNTIWIAGASPQFVLGNLKELSPFRYSIHAKVVETYINFYFYFFDKLNVNHWSMKIANWLEENLTVDEYVKILSKFSSNEKSCVLYSMDQYNRTKHTIKELHITIKKHGYGDIEWVGTYNGKEIIAGTSSNKLFMNNDIVRSVSDTPEIHPDCKVVFA